MVLNTCSRFQTLKYVRCVSRDGVMSSVSGISTRKEEEGSGTPSACRGDTCPDKRRKILATKTLLMYRCTIQRLVLLQGGVTRHELHLSHRQQQ